MVQRTLQIDKLLSQLKFLIHRCDKYCWKLKIFFSNRKVTFTLRIFEKLKFPYIRLTRSRIRKFSNAKHIYYVIYFIHPYVIIFETPLALSCANKKREKKLQSIDSHKLKISKSLHDHARAVRRKVGPQFFQPRRTVNFRSCPRAKCHN